MKKVLLVLLMLLGTNIAHARDLTLNVNATAGGLSGRLAEVLANALDQSGQPTDVKYLGNCKIGEKKFNEGQNDVFVMSLGSVVTGQCSFDVKSHNLIYVSYAQSLSICHDRSRTELGARHFLDDTQKKVLVVTRFFHGVARSWTEDLRLSNTRVISMGRSTDVTAASFGREGDYFALDSTTAHEQRQRLSCIFTTGQKPVEDLSAPTLRKFSSAVRYPEVYATQLITVSGNDPAVRKQWTDRISKAQKSSVYQDFVRRPGVDVIAPGDYWTFYQSQIKVLIDTTEK